MDASAAGHPQLMELVLLMAELDPIVMVVGESNRNKRHP